MHTPTHFMNTSLTKFILRIKPHKPQSVPVLFCVLCDKGHSKTNKTSTNARFSSQLTRFTLERSAMAIILSGN